MIYNDYEYDLEKRTFISKLIDENMPVGQCFTIPEGINSITGFRVKLSKVGSPGCLEYRIGSLFGGVDIACGAIDSNNIIPFYELFSGVDFGQKEVIPGKQYFIWLKAQSGLLPDDGYRIYGPHPGEKEGYKDDLIDNAHWQDPSISISYPKYIFQEGLPKYRDGYGIDENGGSMWSLSFRILTDEKEMAGDTTEDRFECIRQLTTNSYSEWRNIRTQHTLKQDEVEIDNCWFISNRYESRVITNAIEDFENFCIKCMGFELKGKKHTIELILDQSTHYIEEESLIEIKSDIIRISSSNERGIMRAFYYIEDVLRHKKYPSLTIGVINYKPIYPLRMTKGIYSDPYQYFELEEPDIYTCEYLRRISRAGYNAIWLLLNIEQLSFSSSVFPEMNDEKALLVLKRLKGLTERAEDFGIDVYFELRTWHYKPFDTKLYDKYPELRSFGQWNTALTSPCSGNSMVIEFYYQTLIEVFHLAPKIKGMLIIYDTEGFYTCFMKGLNDRCGHCQDKDSVKLAVSFMEMLNDALHSDGRIRSLVLWTYATQGDWSVKVIENCSHLRDLVIMGCFSQFTDINRLGISSKVDDYAVCVSEPSEYFKKLYSISQKYNIPIIAKVEDAYGQEFVNTPYMFTLQQFQNKWEEFLTFNSFGFMANYNHYGFYPSPCADLMKFNCFNASGTRQIEGKDHIDKVIVQNYGTDSATLLKQASQHFSDAMREYFPYSPGVCRYPGPIQSAPSQPFYLDKNRHVQRQRARGNVCDLSWTLLKGWEHLEIRNISLWDDLLVYECLTRFNAEYSKGIECLKAAMKSVHEVYIYKISELIDISETHYICVQTMINFIHFVHLRAEFEKSSSTLIMESIRYILKRELENSEKIHYICENNSIIGLTGSGNGNVRGGLFNPYTIKEKICELQNEIAKLIPERFVE